MKKISILLFMGIVAPTYSFGAALQKFAQPTRTFFSHANMNPPTSPDFKQLARWTAGAIGSTIIGGTVGAVGAGISFEIVNEMVKLHPDSKKIAVDAGIGIGSYNAIRACALSKASRPSAALVAAGAVLGQIYRDSQKSEE